MSEPKQTGRFRPKSYLDMQQQVERIQREGWHRLMNIVDRNVERRREEIEAAGGRFDTSDRDRAIYEAQRSEAYQREVRRMNRAQEYLQRQLPADLEPEPVDIFDSNVGAEERRRNLDRMERRTRTRR